MYRKQRRGLIQQDKTAQRAFYLFGNSKVDTNMPNLNVWKGWIDVHVFIFFSFINLICLHSDTSFSVGEKLHLCTCMYAFQTFILAVLEQRRGLYNGQVF